MERKAAFQMSLGFIIAVVFAIVLLSLALTWLRGLIENVTGITTDLTQEAKGILRDSLKTTGSNFAVYPTQYSLEPDRGLRMSAGIENDAVDGNPHQFVINVVPAATSENVLVVNGCSDFDSCPTLKQEMVKWLTFDSSAGTIQRNEIGDKFIEIRPAADTVKGTYIFNVVACYDKVLGDTPISSTCTQISDNIWGGSAQQFLISVI